MKSLAAAGLSPSGHYPIEGDARRMRSRSRATSRTVAARSRNRREDSTAPIRRRSTSRRAAPHREWTRATPSRPGRRRGSRAPPACGLGHARRTGPSRRRSTAHWSDSSCFCGPAPARRKRGTRRAPSASRRGGCLRATANRAALPRACRVGGHVRLDFFHPRLVGPGRFEFEFEAVHHVWRHIGGIDVELLVPPPQLIDRAVLLDEQRVVDACLMPPDLDVLLESQLDVVAEFDRGPHRLVPGHLGGLLDDDPVLQHKGIRVDRIVAVDEDRISVAVLVVIGQVVDHERRAVVRRHGGVAQHLRAFGVAHVGPPLAVHVLRRDVSLEDVLEVGGQRPVDVVEVRHIHHVVDDFATFAARDSGVPMPVGPLVAGGALDARNRDLGRRRTAFRVIPDEQHAVLFERGPGRRAGQPGCAPRIGHLLASAVAAPAPVMERAGDLVALDLALRQVTAHMPAVTVEHIDVAVAAAETDKLLPEGVDRVRLAVAEISDQSQAVPAAGEPGRRGLGLDEPNLVGISLLRKRTHGSDLTPQRPPPGVCCSTDQDSSSYSTANPHTVLSWLRTARRSRPGLRLPTPASTCWWPAPAPVWRRHWPATTPACRCSSWRSRRMWAARPPDPVVRCGYPLPRCLTTP